MKRKQENSYHTPNTPGEILSDYFSKLGTKGGSSGTGDSKRRTAEHYKNMVAIRNRNRKEKK